MNRLCIGSLFVFFAVATCLGQSTYHGLTPGKSTRPEVERVLGKPVKQHSQTLIEYSPQKATGRIFVQYAPDTSAVERIEFLCRESSSGCNTLVRNLQLEIVDRIPNTLEARNDATGTTLNYYDKQFIVATVDNDSEGPAFSLEPASVALYSQQLFEAAVAEAEEIKKRDPHRLSVSSLRFFESGYDGVPNSWERTYGRRFSGEGTRYINYEITISYPKTKLGKPLTITAVWSRHGSTEPARRVFDNKYDDSSTTKTFSHGIGKENGQGFTNLRGKWTVELFLEGQRVAVGSFEVY